MPSMQQIVIELIVFGLVLIGCGWQLRDVFGEVEQLDAETEEADIKK